MRERGGGVKAEAVTDLLLDLGFKPVSLDASGVLALTQHTPGWDHAGDRIGSGSANGHVRDRVIELVIEYVGAPGRSAVLAPQPRFGAGERFRL